MSEKRFFPHSVWNRADEHSSDVSREQLPTIGPTAPIYTDGSGRRWATKTFLRSYFKVKWATIEEHTLGKETIDGVRADGRKQVKLYDVDDLAKEIGQKNLLPLVDPKAEVYIDPQMRRWAPSRVISQLTGLDDSSIAIRAGEANRIPGLDDWRTVFLYPLDLFSDNIAAFEKYPRADKKTGIYTDDKGERWATLTTIADMLGAHGQSLRRHFANEETIQAIDSRSHVRPFYRVAVIQSKWLQMKSLPQVNLETGIYVDPEGGQWGSIRQFEIKYGASRKHKHVKNFVKSVRTMPGLGLNGEQMQMYSFDELVEKVDEYWSSNLTLNENTGIYSDPEGRNWASEPVLGALFRVPVTTLRMHVRDREVEFIELPVRQRGRARMRVYPVDLVGQIYREKVAISNFKDFLLDPKTQTLLQGVIRVYGSTQVKEIVYAIRPDFKDVPGDTFDGYISEFLGEYLPSPGPLSAGEIEIAVQHLRNEDQVQILSTIVRHDCLHEMLLKKKAGVTDDKETARQHIAQKRVECASFMTPAFEEILNETERFFCETIYGYQKTSRMVDEIKSDRPFPDIYQRINCGEIADKKRLLIADEMGVGKSASAIFSKESLGVQCALVVVPANVQETWLEYLSDKVDGKRGQVGYFKPGQSPRVLQIDNRNDLRKLEDGLYDYIVISQEKLNNGAYRSKLLNVDYQMLIVDEMHKAKKEKGNRAQAILDLASKIEGEGKYLAMLSGTPIPNKISDVAMILRMLHPQRFAETSRRELITSIVSGTVGTRSLLAPYMQMKSLAEHVELPELIEEVIEVELNSLEAELYKSLLEDDEYTPNEKISILLKFLLNPKLLNITPEIVPSKIQAARDRLALALQTRDKPIMFVNGFISNVIRGEESIVPDLNIPSSVKKDVIHGQNRDERSAIVEEFCSSPGKHFLAISGETMGVGVSLTDADFVMHYNDPWTLPELWQQIARAQRPGQKKSLIWVRMRTRGTIEEGISRYIEIKYNAVEKILRGGILTDLEREILLHDDKFDDDNLELNAELAKFYFNETDKINKVYFQRLKHLGETGVRKLLGEKEHGKEYARAYEQLVGVSYQANVNRVCVGLIRAMAQEKGRHNPRILDLGSGPEMLARHSQETRRNIMSVDLNEAHFPPGRTIGEYKVASYRETGEATESYDFVNMALALHHEPLNPRKKIYDSAEVLMEIARVLKMGGRAVISEIYSLNFKNLGGMQELATALGLKMITEYTGDAVHGSEYCSRVVTFEKVAKTPEKTPHFFETLPRHVFDGLKMKPNNKHKLRGQRKIVTKFTLGSKTIDIPLNTRDRMLVEEEDRILKRAAELKQQYGAYEAIDEDVLVAEGFGRMRPKKNYILFRLSSSGGMIVAR